MVYTHSELGVRTMKTPAIVLNMKTYEQALGENGRNLAKICEEVSKNTGVEIVISPTMIESALAVSQVDIPVFVQHADNIKPGSGTGMTPLEAVKSAGLKGVIINHSENRQTVADIGALVVKAKQLGLETIVCTNDEKTSVACAVFEPDFIAVEPPELIGGDISVTTANPEIISDTVNAIHAVSKTVKVLTGAGIKNGKDIETAIELGCHGVLLASGVVKSKDPKAVLLDMADGVKRATNV